MNNPKITIIIPIYNAEQYLNECLYSVINQSYKNLEILCIDDGSTDNSFKLLKEMQKEDERIIVITQTNQGQGTVRNNGINTATGDYVMFLDSDDYLERNACEILKNKIQPEMPGFYSG